MIVSAGQRTDIVAFYTPWLLRRLDEGYVLVRNPVAPERVTRYVLDPAVVDCLALCSKNYAPLLPRLSEIGLPLLCFATVTAYGRDIEPGVPDLEERVESVLALSAALGPRRVIWRYDPVLLTPRYSVEHHLAAFDWLCGRLAGKVDRCVFSFLHPFPLLGVRKDLRLLEEDEKRRLAQGLALRARRRGLPLQGCAGTADHGPAPAGCLTREALERSLGVPFKRLPPKGLRPGCRCAESRDIGAYDSCLHGCAYCYATRSPALVQRNFRSHDPNSPLLLGHLRAGDQVFEAEQRSFRAGARALSLPGLRAPSPQ